MEKARRSLSSFVRLLWPVVETRTFVHNWHIDAICDHLTAVSMGQIHRLVINIPPRHTKSMIVSVMWPAWNWLHCPGVRWVYASYAQALSTRDSVKCRRIIQSPLYQQMITINGVPLFSLMGDQNTKTRFENDRNGHRIATSVDSYAAGEGGDRVVIDDPHNTREADSEQKRYNVRTWYDEAMSTRLDDIKTGAYVLIMQRLHEADLTGHILSKENQQWDKLILPARYEKPTRVESSIDFKDPRTEEDELLFPERFGKEELEQLDLSEYAEAGQLQQRPSPRSGGMFKPDKFEIRDSVHPKEIVKSVRYWDKAGTQGGGKRTAGVLMHELRDGTFLVGNVVKGQWGASVREPIIKQTAKLDGPEVEVWVEQEPGSGGKESAEGTIKNLAGFTVYAEAVTGSKETRAEPYSCQVNNGNVAVLKGDYAKNYIDEHILFPMGNFKDQVDAGAGAFNKLTLQKKGKKKTVGVW